MTPTRWILPLCLFSLGVAACGGTVSDGAADGSSGGTSSGGSGSSSGGSASGGAGSSSGGGGSASGGAATGTGGGIGACCLAVALCDEGDKEIASADECPPGANCYSNQICCSTVWCVDQTATCDAIPVCAEGELEVSFCPEGATCHTRSMCGTSILCQAGSCNPEFEPYRDYVGSSQDECALIDFICPDHTTMFGNGCGCGCEQPGTCPEYVDCMPSLDGPAAALCSSNECPYSQRVY